MLIRLRSGIAMKPCFQLFVLTVFVEWCLGYDVYCYEIENKDIRLNSRV